MPAGASEQQPGGALGGPELVPTAGTDQGLGRPLTITVQVKPRLTGYGAASGLSDGGSQMVAEGSEADLDLLDLPLEADGELGPAVPAGLVDDLPQEHGLLLPDLMDGAESAVDLVGLGLEQLPHREKMAVPTVERQLGSSRQERRRALTSSSTKPDRAKRPISCYSSVPL